MIYHYTTIETLDAILTSKSIKFNKLTNLDDREEEESFIGPFNPKEYIFVSCWSKDPQENIMLWNCYTDNKIGVRIGLPDMPFPLYDYGPPFKIIAPIDPNDPPKLLLPFWDAFGAEYFVFSHYYIKDDFEKHIIYLDEKELQQKYLEYAIKSYDRTTNTVITYSSELGLWKNKIWEAQKEFRFVLNIIPQSPEFFQPFTPEFRKKYIDGIFYHINNKTKHRFNDVFLNLKPEVLSAIEIVLSPYAGDSDYERVTDILDKHGLRFAEFRKSSLKIRRK